MHKPSRKDVLKSQDLIEHKLTKKQRLRIQTRHKMSIERHGYKPQALYWSNQEIQEIRFQTLMQILPKASQLKDHHWSLLDVGCGFADLYSFLNTKHYFPQYSGIDISPDMVSAAQSIHGEIDVMSGELSDFDFQENQFDYVFLSGALNEVVETELEGLAEKQGQYARSTMQTMYAISKAGVAFNLLDARHPWVKSRSDLQSFLPEDIVAFCQTFADKVTLIEGYLENDFTVLLHKDNMNEISDMRDMHEKGL